ncbi:MAG TPA: hypothetical protein VFJ85_03420 [Acidimicrobiales bacterium]|nr:hypothetical protein [Acidimicrobiales bacterium]
MGDRSDSLAVHRRSTALAGAPVTILRLRPGSPARFATNRYHETWHVLSDLAGGRLLGRLCWALSFQRRPGTLVVLAPPEVVPNPFDADPSNPVVLVNTDLGPFTAAMAADLKLRLRRPARSDGTVVLRTPGLDAALGDRDAFHRRPEQSGWHAEALRPHTRIERRNGVVVVAAPAPVLRAWAVDLTRMGEWLRRGSSEVELDWPTSNGEVQVFPDFEARVAAARSARERLFPGRAHQELAPEERQLVWAG